MDATTVTTALLLKTPLLVPLAAFAVFIIPFSVLTIACYFIAYGVLQSLRAPPPPAKTANGKPGGAGDELAHTVIVVNIPGLGNTLSGAFNLVYGQVQSLLSSLSAFATVSFLILIVAALIAGFGIIFSRYSKEIVRTLGETYTCTFLPVWNVFLQLFNMGVFLVGIVWAGITFYASIAFLEVWVWVRILLTCVVANDKPVIESAIVALANMLSALFTALRDYMTSGDLGHARINLLPFMARFADLVTVVTAVADCTCSYLDFFWQLTFGVFQEQALATAVDAIVNMAVRLLQLIANSIVEADAPDFGPFFAESIVAVLATSDVGGILVVYVLNVVAGFLDLIPIAAATSPDATANMAALGYSQADTTAMLLRLSGIATVSSTQPRPTASMAVDTARIVMALRQPDVLRVAVNGNLSDVIGLRYIIGVMESPWPRVVGNLVAGALAFTNNTLNLFRLSTHATNSYADIAYVQFGYIFDWWRDAGFALGKLFAAFYAPLEMPIADIPNIATGIIQIILELGIHLFIDNLYLFPSDGNIFKFFITYCRANNTAASENYRLLYNHSAAIAELFGCDPNGDAPFSVESPGAVCADNVAGCLALSSYRILVEVVDLVERHACYLSELVQFNKDKVHFGYINYDPLFRALIHFAECVRRLFYWIDTPLQSIGDPPGQPCQYTGTNGQILFKRAFLCAIGNIVNAGLLFGDSVLYELLRLARSLLESFAQVPDVTVEIPTLASANADFKAALCQLGAVIGSLVPVTFSCSAQALAWKDSSAPATSIGVIAAPPPIPPSTQTQTPAPIVETARRLPPARVCSYSRTDWATDPVAPCNCSTNAAGLVWGGNATTACFLECLTPGVEFPFFVGAKLLPNAAFGGTVPVDTVFTNASTLRAFLRATLPIEGTGVPANTTLAAAETVDPTGAEPEADFVAELVVATLNERFQRLYGPAYETSLVLGTYDANASVYYNGTFDYNGTCGGHWVSANETSFRSTMQLDVTLISTRQYVDMMNRYVYAMANYGSAGYASLFAQNAPPLTVNKPYTVANDLNLLYGWPNAPKPWYQVANAMLEGLRLYNRAFLNCGATAPEAACFTTFRVVQPEASPQAWDTALPATVLANATGTASVVTWSPIDLGQIVFDGIDCDCANYQRHYYDTTLRQSQFAGACLLLCDPPSYPLRLGTRPDATYIAGFSDMTTGLEITNLVGLRGILFNGQLPAPPSYLLGEDGASTRNAAVDATATGAYAGELMAARINTRLLKRYLPNRYLFVRPFGDPLLNKCGLANKTDDALLWAGVRVDLMVDVLSVAHFGDLNDRRDCLRHFPFDSTDPRYSLCIKFVQRFGPQTAYPGAATFFSANMTATLTLLEKVNSFRPQANATLGNDCFLIATLLGDATDLAVLPPSNFTEPLADPALPPLDFVSIVYYAIPIDDVKTIVPCGATISCTAETFCSFALVLGAPGDVVVNILEQIRLAVATGSGTWTLGTGFWDLAKNVLLSITQHLGAAVLHLDSLGDCIICAIAGNVKGDFCDNGIFRLFRTTIITLQTLAALVITFVVDTVALIFTLIYDLCAQLFGPMMVAIVGWLKEFLFQVIVPFFETLFGFLLGFVCACGLWNLIPNVAFTCTNSDICPSRKRDVSDAAYFLGTITTTLSYTYQTFAWDWPASPAYAGAWPPAHPCATSMPALEAAASSHTLTRDQADEAAYCLGLVVLYRENVTTTPLALYDGADSCQTLMDDLFTMSSSVPTGHASYAAMDAFQRAQVRACVTDRAFVHGMKRASGGPIDFVPSNIMALSNGVGPATVIPFFFDAIAAYSVDSHRAADTSYAPVVVGSADYQAGLRVQYGQPRADLAQQVAVTGQAADHMAYTDAIYGPAAVAAASRKRGLLAVMQQETVMPPQRMARVAQMAALIGGISAAAGEHLMPAYFNRLETRSAILPPPLSSMPDGSVETANLSASTLDPTAAFTPADPTGMQQVKTLMARMTNTAARVVLTAWGTSQDAESRKRGIGSAEQQDKARADLRSGLILAGRALKAGLTATREIVSGRAYLNATANVTTNASITSVRWVLPERVGLPTYAATGMAPSMYFAVGGRAGVAGDNTLPRPVVLPVAANGVRRLSFIGEGISRPWRTTMQAKAAMSARLTELQRTAYDMAKASGDPGRISRNPLERSRRMQVALGAASALWTQLKENRSSVTGLEVLSRTSIFLPWTMNAAALNGTDCLSGVPELCQQCYGLDKFVGYVELAVLRLVGYFASIAAQYWNTLSYAYDEFRSTQDYLTNTSIPLRVGNSPSLPAEFPDPDHSVLDYFDDPLPKVGFTDIADLTSATWNFFSGAFPSLTDPSTWNLAITATGNTTASAPSQGLVSAMLAEGEIMYAQQSRMWATNHTYRASRPKPLRPAFTMENAVLPAVMQQLAPVVQAGGWLAVHAWSAATTATTISDVAAIGISAITSLKDAALQWIELFFFWFISCDYNHDLDGTQLRVSLTIGAFIGGILGITISAVLSQVPVVGPFILSFISGSSYILLALGLILSVSTNWSLLCAPALPQVLWSKLLVHTVTEVWTAQCLVVGAGLANERYLNTECRSCARWQAGQWSFASPREDLGWTGFADPVVFPLKQWAPGLLDTARDPAQWGFPMRLFIASDLWQEWTHRWDSVDMSNRITYRQQWTAWGISLVVVVMVLPFVVALLAFEPTFAFVKVVLAAVLALILAGISTALGGIFVAVALTNLGDTLVARSAALEAEKDKVEKKLADARRRYLEARLKQVGK